MVLQQLLDPLRRTLAFCLGIPVRRAACFGYDSAVINGASELLGELFGERGSHARSAVGVAALPLDAPVELELQVEIQRTT